MDSFSHVNYSLMTSQSEFYRIYFRNYWLMQCVFMYAANWFNIPTEGQCDGSYFRSSNYISRYSYKFNDQVCRLT